MMTLILLVICLFYIKMLFYCTLSIVFLCTFLPNLEYPVLSQDNEDQKASRKKEL